MALIHAIITYKENTLVTEFPKFYIKIYQELCSIGSHKDLEMIPLTDDEGDDLRVKLYADSDIGNHLLLILDENSALADANTAAFAVMNADEDIKEELEQNLVTDQYSNTVELLRDIRKLTDQAGPVKMSFFCLLEGKVKDAEYGRLMPVGNYLLKSNKWNILELLELEQSSPEDEVGRLYDDDESIRAKLVSATWTVDEYRGKLYGRIDCRFKKELSEDETEKFKEWLVGQCLDGFGEHFEQQPIRTKDGDLFISFWVRSSSCPIMTRDELDAYIDNQQMTMGGI